MYLNNLVIEITRRCNMLCSHCLRGEAQNKYISDKTLQKFFFKIRDSFIGTLTITGGEPSLAPSRIRAIRQHAIWNRVRFNSFYIVTNGKKLSKDFINAIYGLQQYCDCPDECTIQYSSDKFHTRALDIDKLEPLEFFQGGKGAIEYYQLINEGRAAENYGGRELHLDHYVIDEDNIREGLFYLNSLGNILPSCDLSYESQDNKNMILGNVNDDTFDLFQYAKDWNVKLDEIEAEKKRKEANGTLITFDHDSIYPSYRAVVNDVINQAA